MSSRSLIELQKQVTHLEVELAKSDALNDQLSAENKRLSSELNRAHERVGQLHDVLLPRWRTILTLKPVRFAYRLRSQLKSGQISFDEHGIPLKDNATASSDAYFTDAAPISLLKPPPERTVPSFYADWAPQKPMGIAVFAYDRTQNLEAVLESLKLQDALGSTHVFIDGDQGNPAKRKILDQTEAIAHKYDIAALHRQRSNFGFRKLMIISMKRMFDMYEHVLFLEDDCFPVRNAIRGFSRELTDIENEPDILSVYGHHFGVEDGTDRFSRFQGWGWASTRQKMMNIWPALRDAYMMSEEEYLSFVSDTLTDEVRARLDVTPGRDPLDTLTKFFAWDETLAMLSAAKGLSHRPSRERLIYNFGLGHGSTHFGANPVFRNPPFNMITPDEIWEYF